MKKDKASMHLQKTEVTFMDMLNFKPHKKGCGFANPILQSNRPHSQTRNREMQKIFT